MARGNHRQFQSKNKEAFKYNKQLKQELVRLKYNFEIKLKARENKVQTVCEE